MARLLFTHSYFYRFDPKQWANQKPYPPYGTIYAAAYMRQQGHQVSLFDTNLKEGPEELEGRLSQEKPDYLLIYDDGFNYLTKMCLTNMREAAYQMCKMGQAAGCKVIVCSSDSTDHYEDYLNEGADFVLLGEGEESLRELVAEMEAGQTDYLNIKGIAYLQDDKLIRTAPRPVLKDLDSLPNPAWDLVDMEEYREIWMKAHGYFSLNFATTRGCPYKCNWCAKPIYGNTYNMRSPKRMVDEIEMLVNDFGAQHFWVCDDIFALKVRWLREFRQEVEQRQLKFKYQIQSRADLLVKENYIDDLVASGLHEAWMGAESGSQKILDAMDKGTRIEQIYEATRLLKAKGVRVAFFLQFGYLGETHEDIRQTIQMVKDLVPDEIGISVSYPLPGTAFYDTVKEQLKDKQNWTDSDDLALMYRSTFPPDYYRRLHRYVHKVFRRRQGWQNLKRSLANPFRVGRSQLRSALLTAYYLPASLVDAFRLKRLEKPL